MALMLSHCCAEGAKIFFCQVLVRERNVNERDHVANERNLNVPFTSKALVEPTISEFSDQSDKRLPISIDRRQIDRGS